MFQTLLVAGLLGANIFCLIGSNLSERIKSTQAEIVKLCSLIFILAGIWSLNAPEHPFLVFLYLVVFIQAKIVFVLASDEEKNENSIYSAILLWLTICIGLIWFLCKYFGEFWNVQVQVTGTMLYFLHSIILIVDSSGTLQIKNLDTLTFLVQIGIFGVFLLFGSSELKWNFLFILILSGLDLVLKFKIFFTNIARNNQKLSPAESRYRFIRSAKEEHFRVLFQHQAPWNLKFLSQNWQKKSKFLIPQAGGKNVIVFMIGSSGVNTKHSEFESSSRLSVFETNKLFVKLNSSRSKPSLDSFGTFSAALVCGKNWGLAPYSIVNYYHTNWTGVIGKSSVLELLCILNDIFKTCKRSRPAKSIVLYCNFSIQKVKSTCLSKAFYRMIRIFNIFLVFGCLADTLNESSPFSWINNQYISRHNYISADIIGDEQEIFQNTQSPEFAPDCLVPCTNYYFDREISKPIKQYECISSLAVLPAIISLILSQSPDHSLDRIKSMLAPNFQNIKYKILNLYSLFTDNYHESTLISWKKLAPGSRPVEKIPKNIHNILFDFYSPFPGVYQYPGSAGEGVNVYVIDQGVDWTHSEFQNSESRTCKIIHEWTNNNQFVLHPSYRGVYSREHGTACASCIVGNVCGVAKKANIISVVFALGPSTWTSDLMKAFEWILQDHKNRSRTNPKNTSIISVSWELNDPIKPGSTYQSLYFTKIMKSVLNAGIHVVSSGGNIYQGDSCKVSFGKIKEANISVSGLDYRLDASEYSQGSCINFFAPGSQVQVASIKGGESNHNYTKMSGTSVSCPLVAGILALYLGEILARSKDSSNSVIPTPQQLKDILIKNSHFGFLKGLNESLRRVTPSIIPNIASLNICVLENNPIFK